ncbi:cytochrome P450 [Priestia endophytica]|uniref:cytochrome P450 n=1 Tax=Priestia endophytica TaxID=135735 RepID=UPI002280FB55|nr:cytochrome P450 [Priestia endophytica]MCY8235479.1 cytochrome P450 [Priestia endophytica]
MKINTTNIESFSFNTLEFFQNPYPFYEEMRSINPIYKSTLLKYQGWYITGYEETVKVLKDSRFHSRPPIPAFSRNYENLRRIQENMMLFTNPQHHRRLRSLVTKFFTPNIINECHPFIEKTVDELIDQVICRGTMEVVSDFAFPLASSVIAKILGVPVKDRPLFKEWTASFIQSIDFMRSPKTLGNSRKVTEEIIAYFKKIIKAREQAPKEDLISKLIQEKQREEKLSYDELIATCVLLLIAGHETTVNLISSSIFLLIQNPRQLEKLQDDSKLITTALEEFLRFESPAQLIARTASEDITVNEAVIRKGEQVYLFLGAANRDSRKFRSPHQLDITRNPNPHLAFGHSSHFCLGSSLARLEAKIAIERLLQKVRNLQAVDGNGHYRKIIGFKSLVELHVTFDSFPDENFI